MQEFYTNVSPYGDELLVRGFTGGKRFTDRLRYAPKLYHPYKGKTTHKSLDGTPLIARTCKTVKEARILIKRYEDHPNFLYGTDRWQYQYMADYWPGEIEYDKEKLRIYTIDIEVESEYGFPHVDDADEKMICITIKDQIKKQFLVWGMADYKVSKDNVSYVKCKDEKDLLIKFLKFWREYTPDVVTGWNSKYFDMPYLINRTKKVLGEHVIKRYSPWDLVDESTAYHNGRQVTFFRLLGIAQLDYLQLYAKFTIKNQERYTLDHIAFVELGEQKDKNPYDTFKEWYQNDIQSFIDYNVIDVELVDKLEDRLQLIELALTMAYHAKANYEDVFSQVRMWDTIIFNELLKDNIVVPMRKVGRIEAKELVGAYVKEPKTGFHEWVVSFDLNSLYPHLIMQYNISPETILEGQVYIVLGS